MGTAKIESVVPGRVFRKPESNPLMVTFVSCAGMQGSLKVDSVAVWFPVATVVLIRLRLTDRRGTYS